MPTESQLLLALLQSAGKFETCVGGGLVYSLPVEKISETYSPNVTSQDFLIIKVSRLGVVVTYSDNSNVSDSQPIGDQGKLFYNWSGEFGMEKFEMRKLKVIVNSLAELFNKNFRCKGS